MPLPTTFTPEERARHRVELSAKAVESLPDLLGRDIQQSSRFPGRLVLDLTQVINAAIQIAGLFDLVQDYPRSGPLPGGLDLQGWRPVGGRKAASSSERNPRRCFARRIRFLIKSFALFSTIT